MKPLPDYLRMFALLAATKELLERSSEEGWCSRTITDALNEVNAVINHVLVPKDNPSPDCHDILFAPTGTIHEISLSNGWDEQFGLIADEYEHLRSRILRTSS